MFGWVGGHANVTYACTVGVHSFFFILWFSSNAFLGLKSTTSSAILFLVIMMGCLKLIKGYKDILDVFPSMPGRVNN